MSDAERAEATTPPPPRPHPRRGGSRRSRIRIALGSPARLRDVIVLQEVLAPPLGMRDGQRL